MLPALQERLRNAIALATTIERRIDELHSGETSAELETEREKAVAREDALRGP